MEDESTTPQVDLAKVAEKAAESLSALPVRKRPGYARFYALPHLAKAGLAAMRIYAFDSTGDVVICDVEADADGVSAKGRYGALDERAGVDPRDMEPFDLAVVRVARMAFEAAKAAGDGSLRDLWKSARLRKVAITVRLRGDLSGQLSFN